ncbi:restriction endonuclease [Streptomyces sp. OF3]|uniref:Restriction endonuclease n=1 Tax=Streptomyces alkaliterrae TaxID=2213162 RepID=A0A7W3WGJ3_9ACTN|nr:NaeI family type II restriction endonuclease [Streptomyces alkaliterrae]MBB1251916.1 restriction endonuclease [Streptomyces alkaliterrae]
MEERFASVLRQSIDEVLDGQRTGRFDVDELDKTEKTYLGTRVEIVARAAFGLGYGRAMDYEIAGHEVDAKFTSGRTWTIPKEAMGHLCLVMSADDHRGRFEVGLLRITEDVLRPGYNQDKKRGISAQGRHAIHWLVMDGALPANVLLSLRDEDHDAIFRASDGYRGGGNGGQLRINELFRRVAFHRTPSGPGGGCMVDRTTTLTVASQQDSPKRVRDARLPQHLGREGIIILGHQRRHAEIARTLGVPVPDRGSWVAARLTYATEGSAYPVVELEGRRYALAGESDVPAPPPTEY